MTYSSSPLSIARKALAATALSAVCVLGAAGVASAQDSPDQHSGGVSDENTSRDPGDPREEVLGVQVNRQGALPLTGSDVAGIALIGAGAIAVGAGAVAVSRRESRGASA